MACVDAVVIVVVVAADVVIVVVVNAIVVHGDSIVIAALVSCYSAACAKQFVKHGFARVGSSWS